MNNTRIATIGLLLFTSASLFASTGICPPSLAQESVAVADDCGLDPFVAAPGASFWFGWEDLKLASSDKDFNDFMGTLEVSGDGTSALLTFLGENALFFNSLYSGGTLLFTSNNAPGDTATIPTVPDQFIPLKLVTYSSNANLYGTWYNSDRDHFRDGGQVPEPATLSMLGSGLLAVGLARIKLRK